MNCCDASGRCRCPNGERPLRFAPGVIEHTPRRAFGSAQQQRELRRVLLGWAIRLVFAVALCAAAGIGGLLAAAVIRAMGR